MGACVFDQMEMDQMNGNNNGTTSLVRIIKLQKWATLEKVLVSGAVDMIPFDDSPLEQRLAGTDRILHLACQFQAPLRIVQLLSDRHPMSIRTLDDDGRYPLHIACARGAKPKVINYMLDACNMAVRWQDKTGKLPLHHLGESWRKGHKTVRNTRTQPEAESMLSVASMLLFEFPESPIIEDNEETNSIEYAIQSGADIKVVKRMQNESRNSWRRLKKRNESMSHDDLRLSMRSSIASSMDLEEISGLDVSMMDEGNPDYAPGSMPPLPSDLEKLIQTARMA